MFRFTCSVVLWGGRGTAKKYHWHVWGVLTLFQPHWVCPCSRCVCFLRLHCSGSKLLSKERALICVHFSGPSCSGSGFRVLHRGTDSAGPAFCAFPGWSSSGSQELDQHILLRCSATSPLPVPACFWHSRPSVPCVSSRELISGCDPRSRCQTSRISGSL